MKVKICGITRLEDAQVAANAGAWAVGFIFYAKSPRAIDPERAREIVAALPPTLEKVGVFVNEEAGEIERIARTAGLTRIQLHGDEAPRDCSRLSLPVTKVFRDSGSPQLAAYAGVASAFLLDSQAPPGVWGGTGRAADREFAKTFRTLRDQQAPKLPYFLAGGLDPSNVAFAIAEISPDGLDVSSGVEEAPGIKSAAKIQAFLKASRAAAKDLSHG